MSSKIEDFVALTTWVDSKNVQWVIIDISEWDDDYVWVKQPTNVYMYKIGDFRTRHKFKYADVIKKVQNGTLNLVINNNG